MRYTLASQTDRHSQAFVYPSHPSRPSQSLRCSLSHLVNDPNVNLTLPVPDLPTSGSLPSAHFCAKRKQRFGSLGLPWGKKFASCNQLNPVECRQRRKRRRCDRRTTTTFHCSSRRRTSLPISIVATFEHYVHGQGWVTRSVVKKASTLALRLAKYVNDIVNL